jgi:hypothetical protein
MSEILYHIISYYNILLYIKIDLRQGASPVGNFASQAKMREAKATIRKRTILSLKNKYICYFFFKQILLTFKTKIIKLFH